MRIAKVPGSCLSNALHTDTHTHTDWHTHSWLHMLVHIWEIVFKLWLWFDSHCWRANCNRLTAIVAIPTVVLLVVVVVKGAWQTQNLRFDTTHPSACSRTETWNVHNADWKICTNFKPAAPLLLLSRPPLLTDSLHVLSVINLTLQAISPLSSLEATPQAKLAHCVLVKFMRF